MVKKRKTRADKERLSQHPHINKIGPVTPGGKEKVRRVLVAKLTNRIREDRQLAKDIAGGLGIPFVSGAMIGGKTEAMRQHFEHQRETGVKVEWAGGEVFQARPTDRIVVTEVGEGYDVVELKH